MNSEIITCIVISLRIFRFKLSFKHPFMSLVMICISIHYLKRMRVCMSAIMHTCDLDWGRTVVLMLCVLLMLKLRLWEDVRD